MTMKLISQAKLFKKKCHYNTLESKGLAKYVGNEEGNNADSTSVENYFFGEAPIQRSVGFEVEVGYVPFWDQAQKLEVVNRRIPFSKTNYPMFSIHDCVLEGNGFELQVDVSFPENVPYLEFVTSPFEESEKGYDRMVETISIISNLMEELDEKGKLSKMIKAKSVLPKFGKLNPAFEEIELFSANNPKAGYFQFTAGISLECLPIVYDDVAMPKPDESEEMSQRRKKMRELFSDWTVGNTRNLERQPGYLFRQVVDVLNDMQLFQELENASKGFLLQLFQYLVFSDKKQVTYAKSMPVILSRTDFAAMFEHLPLEDKKRLSQEEVWLPFFDQAMERLNLGSFQLPVFSKGVYQTDKAEERQQIFSALSRQSWFEHIVEGTDMLTSRNFPDEQWAHKLESLGSLGSQMDMDDDGVSKLPVFEFRYVCEIMPYHRWLELCKSIFLWVHALNQKKDLKFNEATEEMFFAK
ncbi:hypothetical protein [Aureibacter tunicatorum]|uniref:Uncharacterized protein n=1 Tax=Aureibacter tunicatorum TaxID=866807 RepID=A0AAE4BU49_9BACT|nr:hypothetical protein [Aureibacter tunicatorum]MDR6241421.1 hypothetical protein [Aureibacter tunicatorum]BDD06734.1 hypothetical protein AUTU_42170 [Aureibacter tunicatorum]